MKQYTRGQEGGQEERKSFQHTLDVDADLEEALQAERARLGLSFARAMNLAAKRGLGILTDTGLRTADRSVQSAGRRTEE